MAIANPYRPGAGHQPPFLAGRQREMAEFRRLLNQRVISENMILTGLRGVGKTSLLTEMKPVAEAAGWLWTGDNINEQTTFSEDRICTRIITDLSVRLSAIFTRVQADLGMGFTGKATAKKVPLGYHDLQQIFDQTPGLNSDKLKAVLRYVGQMIAGTDYKGIVFAYDEAQKLSDHAKRDEFPLALLLDTFESIQKHPGGLPFMLVLTGLPTLFPTLVQTRTYVERMFRVVTLTRLSEDETREAITVPLQSPDSHVHFFPHDIESIVNLSGNYPYFVQYFCRDAFDVYDSALRHHEAPVLPVDQIVKKLDQDFFMARWDPLSDNQRLFMKVVAQLPNCEDEFTVQDIIAMSKEVMDKPYSQSSVSQYLKRLAEQSLVYKNRSAKWQFAIPMLSMFIMRQMDSDSNSSVPLASNVMRRPS